MNTDLLFHRHRQPGRIIRAVFAQFSGVYNTPVPSPLNTFGRILYGNPLSSFQQIYCNDPMEHANTDSCCYNTTSCLR